MTPAWEYADRELQLAEQQAAEAQEYADARDHHYPEPRFTRAERAEMNAETARDNQQ